MSNTLDPFGRRAGEPLVVAVTTPFPADDALQSLLAEHVGAVEVHFTPYIESREARVERAANGGVLPNHVDTPEVDDKTLAIWNRTHLAIGIDLPAQPYERMGHLRWFQSMSAGADHIDVAALARIGARFSTASGVASASMAEFVMARLLEVWKNLRDIDRNQSDKVWSELFGSEVGGRTLLMVGLGSIGRQVARRAKAFDMQVIATRGSAEPGDTDPDVDELHPADSLDRLLPLADAVVCALPASAATTDLFDARRLGLMKADAIFCNVGRGSLVVEPDLIDALERGHLRAAILDVMRTEPLPETDPLWQAPRIYLSPHSAVSLDRYVQNTWQLTTKNLKHFMAGERLDNEKSLVTEVLD